MSETSGSNSIAIEKFDRVVVGRLTVRTLNDDDLKRLSGLIDQASAENPNIDTVVLDLTQVAMMPSLALGLLVQIGNKCRIRRQQLKLAGPQPQVRRVFAITKLDRVFQFSDTVESAMQGGAGRT